MAGDSNRRPRPPRPSSSAGGPPPPPQRKRNPPPPARAVDDEIDATMQPATPRSANTARRGMPTLPTPPSSGEMKPFDINLDVSTPTVTMDFSTDRNQAVATLLGVDDVASVDLPGTLEESGRTSTGVSSRSSGRLKTIAHTGEISAAAAPAGAGKYEIFGELARGGMGAILRGFDRDIRREIAMKVMLASSPKKGAIARFLEEAQVTGQLEHPNIVPVHEVGVDSQNRLYFTMKLVRGRSLKERNDVARREIMKGRGDGGFPLHQRIDVFKKVCDAMAFAHARGVIHRDLKPENIMLGEYGEVQVMDWGIARVTGRPDTRTEQVVITDRSQDGIARTMDGAVAGTPAYMSPEQAHGDLKKIDQRSDVFALGAILYEMLTFTPPYRGRSVKEVLLMARAGKVELPSDRVATEYRELASGSPATTRRRGVDARLAVAGGPQVPRELEAVVMKAMNPHQAKRYRNVRELRADVDAWVEGRTLKAAEYTSVQLLGKWFARNRTAAIGAAATLLVAIAGIVALIIMDRNATQDRIEAETRAAVESAQKTRDEEAAKARAEDTQAATTYWTEAQAALADAQSVEFNPASPQDWYLARLPAARKMGRALQLHPDPPGDWKPRLAEVCEELQTRAEEVADWALALHVAGSAYDWGAVDANERDRRLAEVESARANRAQADVERLQRILGLIRQAETGSGGTPPDEGRRLAPGELDERARQAAAIGGVGVTREALARIRDDLQRRRDGRHTDLAGTERLFIIRVLALRADIHVDVEGDTLPSLTRRVLGQPPQWMDMDEVLAWLWTAARLEARHQCFDLHSLMDLLPDSFSNESSLYRGEIERADSWMKLATGHSGRLPAPSRVVHDPFVDDPEFTTLVRNLGDYLAASAGSGSSYTQVLLEMARSGKNPNGTSLSTRQLAFVLDQIGMHGDLRPPSTDQPDLAAIPVLRQKLEAVSDDWLLDAKPRSADTDEWLGTRYAAVAAALNLARLDDTETARRLWERRQVAGQHSVFWVRTQLPVALLPTIGESDPSSPDPQPGDETLDEWLARGSQASDRGDWRSAIDAWTEALELDPDNQRALAGRAFSQMQLGNLREALTDYNDVIERNPNDSGLYVARSSVWLRMNRPDLARLDYDRALQLDPTRVEAWINRSTLRGNQGDLNGAMEDLQRALQLNKNLPQGWTNLAVIRTRISDTERDPRRRRALLESALEAFDQAARLAPENGSIYASRGACRMRLEDYPGAVVDLDRAIRLDPADSGSRLLRADCHQRIAQTIPLGAERDAMMERALKDYQEAIRLDPRSADARASAAAVLLNMQRTDEARELLDEALRISPRHWMAWMYMGIVRARSGDRAGATEAYNTARANAPAAYHNMIEQYRRQTLGG